MSTFPLSGISRAGSSNETLIAGSITRGQPRVAKRAAFPVKASVSFLRAWVRVAAGGDVDGGACDDAAPAVEDVLAGLAERVEGGGGDEAAALAARLVAPWRERDARDIDGGRVQSPAYVSSYDPPVLLPTSFSSSSLPRSSSLWIGMSPMTAARPKSAT